MAELKFKRTFTQNEYEVLRDLATKSNRSVDNVAETLVLLAIDAHRAQNTYLSLLGNINYNEEHKP